MLPQEVKEIGFDKLLISMENCKPIFADKIIYWRDPAFADRINIPAPVVPVLEIVMAKHRTRPILAEEVASIDLVDIVNKDKILKAIGDAIGVDFANLVIPVDAEAPAVAFEKAA